MNRRRGWIPLTLGLLLAVGTAVATFLLLQQQRAAAAAEAAALAAAQVAPLTTMQLPVAARPLAPGTTITAEDILVKDFPLELVPLGAITETITLESQILAEPIGQGETFSPSQLVGETGSRASRQIEPGQVLFAFPVIDLLSTTDVIQDGDRIDMLITLPVEAAEGAGPGPVTAFTLQNITVFRVIRAPGDEDGEVGAASALLLSVRPEEAVMLKHVNDTEGLVDFVLRSALTNEPSEAPPVDREDLIELYLR